ncbi:MAG: hypothetical protein HYT87_05775 [Nitrospirae bacterium]|nr:hypothetical protein [Nitrospirota bacterium]
MLKTTVLVVGSFSVQFLVHLLVFHFRTIRNRFKTILGIAWGGLALYGILYFTTPNEGLWFVAEATAAPVSNPWILAGHFLLGVLLYAFFFMGYLEFYFTADRSISFRIMMMAEDAPGKTIRYEELVKTIDPNSIIDWRLDDLVYGGYLTRQDKSYSITRKGYVTQKFYRFAVKFLNLGGYH